MVFWLCLVFLFLLPFLDGGSNFLAEILLLTLPLPLFLIGLSRREFDFHNLRPSIIISWLIFLGFLLLSVLTSTSQIFSIPAFFQTLAIFLFFLLFLLTAEEKKLKFSFGLVMLVAAGLSLVSFYYLLPGVAKPPVGMNLVYASYGHNHLADVLLLAIPLALAFFLQVKERPCLPAGRSRELLLGLLILLYIVALVLTFSRGAFIVLPPVVLLLIFLAKPKLVSQKFLSWLLILLPIGLICLIGVFSLSKIGLEAKLAQPQDWLVKQLVKPEFQAKRVEYWQQAIEGFKAKPITGFGWGTFELVALRFQRATAGWSNYTHNFYLQVLAEAGIFAFLSFLSFLGLVFYRIWQLVRKSGQDAFLLGGFGAILASSLHSLLDYDWHFPAVFLLFLLIVSNLVRRAGQEAAGYEIFHTASHGFLQSGALARSLKTKIGLGVSAVLSKFVTPHPLILIFALLVFLFGQLEVLSEYFEQKGDFKKALQLAPWPAVRVRQLGDKIFSQDFAQGEEVAQRVMALSPEDPSMNFWLAQKYEPKGKISQAENYYQKALEFNPLGNFRLYPRLGKIYSVEGKPEKQDKLYQFFAQNLAKIAVTQEDKSLSKTLYVIGQDYLKDGKDEEALFWWKEAADWSPWWSYFYIEVASLEVKRGDREAAKAILDKCLEYDSPRVHCQEYETRLNKGTNFDVPGFWQEKIRNIAD